MISCLKEHKSLAYIQRLYLLKFPTVTTNSGPPMITVGALCFVDLLSRVRQILEVKINPIVLPPLQSLFKEQILHLGAWSYFWCCCSLHWQLLWNQSQQSHTNICCCPSFGSRSGRLTIKKVGGGGQDSSAWVQWLLQQLSGDKYQESATRLLLAIWNIEGDPVCSCMPQPFPSLQGLCLLFACSVIFACSHKETASIMRQESYVCS